MKREKHATNTGTTRLNDLQARFRELEPVISDANVKRALSVMYGMLQETWRQMDKINSGTFTGENSLEDILNLYRHAPKMEGRAVNKPLDEGIKAPDFELNDAAGKLIRLSDYRGSMVLLVFYPLDWSPGCSQQLDLYQSEFAEFEKRKVNIIGISVDSIYSHGAWAAVRNITFPLLSDFNPRGDVARKYRIYREEDGFSERALFIIDREGIIRYTYLSPYIHHIPDIYDLFRKLDEINKPVITV
ncbi:MAG TPA: redoxin domain-containing protein [Bacteroidales bacterium]|jgi:peroxiredoxin|nr:redoxin domain-containing protein [Bacteroidales bacterium]